MDIQMSNELPRKSLAFSDSKYRDLISQKADKVCLQFEPAASSRLPNRRTQRMFVPRTSLLRDSFRVLKRELRLDETQALFFSTGGFHTLNGSMMTGSVYDKWRAGQDKTLVIMYSEIDAFGGIFNNLDQL